MPRAPRNFLGGLCYHVLNRGNDRAQIFFDDDDYRRFIRLMTEASEEVPMDVFSFCLMPNHFHLVLRPPGSNDLSAWMHRLTLAHVRAHHARYATSGHVWGSRFKAFAIEQDEHLLTVLRYVEQNPLKARLVQRAQDWRWSALYYHVNRRSLPFLEPWPVHRPEDWLEIVNQPLPDEKERSIERCISRTSAFGSEGWWASVRQTLRVFATAEH